MHLARFLFRIFYARKFNRMTSAQQAEFLADDFKHELLPKKFRMVKLG